MTDCCIISTAAYDLYVESAIDLPLLFRKRINIFLYCFYNGGMQGCYHDTVYRLVNPPGSNMEALD